MTALAFNRAILQLIRSSKVGSGDRLDDDSKSKSGLLASDLCSSGDNRVGTNASQHAVLSMKPCASARLNAQIQNSRSSIPR